MPIKQYKCRACSAVFECLDGGHEYHISCLNCGSSEFEQVYESSFYECKKFCPKGLSNAETCGRIDK